MVTSWYAGKVLQIYCPAGGPFRTEQMWLGDSPIAPLTPVILLLGRRWLASGLEKR